MPLIISSIIRFAPAVLTGWGLKDIFTPQTKTSAMSGILVVAGLAAGLYFLIKKQK